MSSVYIYISGSKIRVIFPLPSCLHPRDHLAMTGDIFFFCHNRGCVCVTNIQRVEAKHAAKHPKMHKTTFHNKEFSGSKRQQCQDKKSRPKSLMKMLNKNKILSLTRFISKLTNQQYSLRIAFNYLGTHVNPLLFIQI